MKIDLIIEKPTEAPCLMKNDLGQTGLMTQSPDGKTSYITIIHCDDGHDVGTTFESKLKDWKPIPKGAKITMEN